MKRKSKDDNKSLIDMKVIINGLIVAFITAAITGAITLFVGIKVMEANLASINKNIDEINTTIADLPERVANIEGQLGVITPSIKVTLSSAAESSLDIESKSFVLEYLSAGPKWESYDVIGKDESTGVKYKAEELIGKTILLPYESNGQDVFFLGHFNENMHWDGNCIINIYKNNNLILITDAIYIDGVLSSYKQIIPYENKKDGNVWIVSERTKIESDNVGETWNYIRDCEYTKNFDFSSVSSDDILNIDKFYDIFNNMSLVGYYNGKTSDGSYNDDTGNAYLVKFATDGTVRTLYKGRFKNGVFEDITGDAWYIVKEENTNYLYYKGVFKNGGPAVHKLTDDNLTIEEIKEIIEGQNFKCNLKWNE